MLKSAILFLLIFFTLPGIAQNKMRPVEELINTREPGWPLVQGWISKAKNKVEVLPHDSVRSKDALYKTQVTTRSPMGAIIYESGGLIIDGGWIRILGSGSAKLNRSLPDWNKGKTFKEFGETPSVLLIADDAAGGFFAINSGALGTDIGKIYYLSPSDLQWLALEITYSDFLNFCFNGDLPLFYKDLRWKEWKTDAAKLDGNQAYTFFPYLYTKEGKDINKVERNPVPVEELFDFTVNLRKQIGLSQDGLH